ncbi:MAG TPA: hypothetical protein VLF69_05445 [Candidatus Saccharimonadales bacterium]|nr:hypothetical protein [Candidatus Saccharimonadales bacterium]
MSNHELVVITPPERTADQRIARARGAVALLDDIAYFAALRASTPEADILTLGGARITTCNPYTTSQAAAQWTEHINQRIIANQGIDVAKGDQTITIWEWGGFSDTIPNSDPQVHHWLGWAQPYNFREPAQDITLHFETFRTGLLELINSAEALSTPHEAQGNVGCYL